jgi:DNA-binding MarR family transcriptional regulator
MEELYEMPGHLIRRAQQISTALFTDECGAFDLTSVQYAALCAIKANPNVDATRLSALIAFDRSTIGDVVERLESKGWISRRSSLQDRRIKLLRLSPARPARAASCRSGRPSVGCRNGCSPHWRRATAPS